LAIYPEGANRQPAILPAQDRAAVSPAAARETSSILSAERSRGASEAIFNLHIAMTGGPCAARFHLHDGAIHADQTDSKSNAAKPCD
jgi:hypothetical protein